MSEDLELQRNLKAKSAKIAKEIAELESQLQQLRADQEAIAHLLRTGSPKPGVSKYRVIRNISDGLTFRDRVLTALQELNRAVRPVEVTALLEAKGVKNPGKSDFNSRVATELHKLAELKKAIREEGKRYIFNKNTGA